MSTLPVWPDIIIALLSLTAAAWLSGAAFGLVDRACARACHHKEPHP